MERICYKASFHAFCVSSGRSKLNKWFFSSMNVLAYSSIVTVTNATQFPDPSGQLGCVQAIAGLLNAADQISRNYNLHEASAELGSGSPH